MNTTRNYNPPPPLMSVLALITFCALGLIILISALNEITSTTP